MAIPTDRPVHVRVASVTKSFTAVLVLQLVDEDCVDLDRPIDTYLPGVVPGGGDLTVRRILGHRSGLPAGPELDEYDAARTGRTYTPAELAELAFRQPALFAPGARFEYTNTNYLVAGMLVEAVTGHTYADELRTRLLDPLSLTDTYLPAPGETGLRDPHLTGYETVDGTVVDRTRIEPSLAWAAGGLVSTGADLNRFYTALLSAKLVPEALLRQALDGVDMDLQGLAYGLGLIYTDLPCGARYVGHIGGGAGFTALSRAGGPDRAVTISYTGSLVPDDLPGLLAQALCD